MFGRFCSNRRGGRRQDSSKGLDQTAPLEHCPAGEVAGKVQAIIHGPAKQRQGTLEVAMAEGHGVGRRIPES